MSIKAEDLGARLTKAIEANRRAVSKIGATFQVSISGEGGGEWFINCADEPGAQKDTRAKADVSLHMSAETFRALQDGIDINGMSRMIASGKVKVSGDEKLAPKFTELLSLL